MVIAIPTIEREKKLRRESLNSNTESIKLNDKNNSQPNAFFKNLLEDSLQQLEIEDAVWFLNKNGNGYQVTFPCELDASDSVLEFFASKRIGSSKETYIG